MGISDTGLVDRLAAHRTLGAAPRAQLEWLAARGELQLVKTGEITSEIGLAITGLLVLLSGHVSIRVDRGAGPRKVMEWHGGDVTGLLPYSRLTTSPGTARAEEDTEVLYLDREHFPQLIRECHEVTSILVHVMIDRARVFTSSEAQVEKMLSLGRLAAGLAHELNNPASAVARGAVSMKDYLTEAEETARQLAAARLSDDELAAIERARRACSSDGAGERSPLERADREDAMAEWLERRGIESRIAESLAESAVTLEGLDELAAVLSAERLGPALRWVAATSAACRLASEIETASSRIHHLVGAVRGFTYLDQATTPKPVNVGQGLADTLTVLRSKARAKSVTVNLSVPPDLPAIDGYGGELNQVWANLIDNALDALPPSGRIDVSAEVDGGFLVVRIADNGPGIPEAVRPRVFEPFFTTKPVGDGTGLGLDIARRIVNRHEGAIDFETAPGHTEFRVSLPLG